MLGWREKLWVVNFGLGKSNDDCGLGAAGKRISQEEGNCSLMSSTFNVVVGGGLEQLNLNMQVPSVRSWCKVSCVVNYRLELVVVPSWLLSEVVIRAACALTTTFMLFVAVGCVGVGAQLALVASSSVVCGVGF